MKHIIVYILSLSFLIFSSNLAFAAVGHSNKNTEWKKEKHTLQKSAVKHHKIVAEKNVKPNKNEFIPKGWLPIGVGLVLIAIILAFFGSIVGTIGLILGLIGLAFIGVWVYKEISNSKRF